MGKRPPLPMSRVDRAKQFMPFAALGSIEKTYMQRACQSAARRHLGEDRKKLLTKALKGLRTGMSVSIVYYRYEGYRRREGVVFDVNFAERELNVDGETISFDDLYFIKRIGE